jgi:hypothetical protein
MTGYRAERGTQQSCASSVIGAAGPVALAASVVIGADRTAVPLHIPRSLVRREPSCHGEAGMGVWGKTWNRAAWGARGGPGRKRGAQCPHARAPYCAASVRGLCWLCDDPGASSDGSSSPLLRVPGMQGLKSVDVISYLGCHGFRDYTNTKSTPKPNMAQNYIQSLVQALRFPGIALVWT